MKRSLLIAAVWGAGLPCMALPLNLFNDTLEYRQGGMVATANWDTDGSWLHWNISETASGLWHYEYLWHTDGAELSHITIELTENAGRKDFWNWSYQFAGVEPLDPQFGWFSPDTGNSNPGMPANLFGFTLNTLPSVPMFGFSFDTWRSPVWGDFYAKDGHHNPGGPNGGFTYAYNAGFLAADANDGFHIARPNGVRISDGGLTLGLLGVAIIGIQSLRRRWNRIP